MGKLETCLFFVCCALEISKNLIDRINEFHMSIRLNLHQESTFQQPSTDISNNRSRTVGNIDLQLLDFGEKNKKLVELIRTELNEAVNVQDYLERREEQFTVAKEMEKINNIKTRKRQSNVLKRKSLKVGEEGGDSDDDEDNRNTTPSGLSGESKKNLTKAMSPFKKQFISAVHRVQIVNQLSDQVMKSAAINPTNCLSLVRRAQREMEREQYEKAKLQEEQRLQEQKQANEEHKREAHARQSVRVAHSPKGKKWGSKH